VAFALGAAVAAWLVWTGTAYRRAAAEADRLDPGWRWDDLQAARAAVPDAKNAALVIVGLKGRWPAGEPRDDLSVGLTRDLAPNARPAPALAADLRAMLAKAEPALAEARRLAGYDRGRFPADWPADAMDPPTDVMEAGTAATWLRYDAIDRLETGDTVGARTAAQAAFACSLAVGDDPNPQAQLARRTCRTQALVALERLLAQAEPPIEFLADFQARLAVDEPADLWLLATRGMRAKQDRFWEWVVRHTGFKQRLLGPIQYPEYTPARNRAPELRALTACVEALKRPAPERDRLVAAMADAEARAPLPQIAAGARIVQQLGQAFRRSHAHMRCAVAALAAERFRRANGRWPESLSELVAAGLLGEMLTGPFDGQPLRLKRQAGALIVYTVGPDGTNDGGSLHGRGAQPPGYDLEFRLWDADRRRQSKAVD
jgi:hypothetical protein